MPTPPRSRSSRRRPQSAPLNVWKFGGASLADATAVARRRPPDCRPRRSARRRGLGAGRHHRRAARGRRPRRVRPRPDRRPAPSRRCASATAASPTSAPAGGTARRAALAAIDASVGEFAEILRRRRHPPAPVAAHPRSARRPRRAAVGDAAGGGHRPGRPPRRLRRCARHRRHRRPLRRRQSADSPPRPAWRRGRCVRIWRRARCRSCPASSAAPPTAASPRSAAAARISPPRCWAARSRADVVSLWKDVPGILTSDPRLVPDARLIPAAPPSGSRRGRALRRQGAASARAHPDLGHAHRARGALVPRSDAARHHRGRTPRRRRRIR